MSSIDSHLPDAWELRVLGRTGLEDGIEELLGRRAARGVQDELGEELGSMAGGVMSGILQGVDLAPLLAISTWVVDDMLQQAE